MGVPGWVWGRVGGGRGILKLLTCHIEIETMWTTQVWEGCLRLGLGLRGKAHLHARSQLGNQTLDSCAHAGGMYCRPSCSQKVRLSWRRLRAVVSSSNRLPADLYSYTTTCLRQGGRCCVAGNSPCLHATLLPCCSTDPKEQVLAWPTMKWRALPTTTGLVARRSTSPLCRVCWPSSTLSNAVTWAPSCALTLS